MPTSRVEKLLDSQTHQGLLTLSCEGPCVLPGVWGVLSVAHWEHKPKEPWKRLCPDYACLRSGQHVCPRVPVAQVNARPCLGPLRPQRLQSVQPELISFTDRFAKARPWGQLGAGLWSPGTCVP